MSKLIQIAGLVFLIGTPGCQGSPARDSGPANPERQGATEPITIVWTEAPAPGAVLQLGVARFAGHVEAVAGLHPETPCSIEVLNQLSGFSTKQELFLDPTYVTSTWHSFIDRTTGDFLIDIGDDYALSEGPTDVIITFRDANGELATRQWLRLIVESNRPDASDVDYFAARQVYGSSAAGVFASYRDFLAMGVPDETVFTQREFDMEFLDSMESSLIDFMVDHPEAGQWKSIAETWRDTGRGWLEAPGLSTEEELYRRYVYQGVRNYCGHAEMLATSYERVFDLANDPPGSPVPTSWHWDKAFLTGTHFTATTTPAPTGDGYRYTLHIQADQGTRHRNACCGDDPAFIAPIVGTWPTQPPMLELVVDLLDRDNDGASETLEYNGFAVGTEDPEPKSFTDFSNEPLDHFGHLVSPLRVLHYTPWWAPIS